MLTQGRAQSEDVIVALAAQQHGVVTRAQLLDLGLSAEAIDGRLRRGRLRRVHRGVYLLGDLAGGLRPPLARPMAAVLACGPGAAVSHESAAALWGLLPSPGDEEPVDVIVLCRDRGRRPGIRPHRVSRLHERDTARREGVPVTAPPRTLLDLATRLPARTVERAVADAERRGLVTRSELGARLDLCGPRPGVPLLRALIGGRKELPWTRSSAEERFLALVRSGGLPAPRVNARTGGYEVDFLWARERVVVEVDGFAHHASRRSFESDRRRDAELAARGLVVVRVTWRQIADEPHALLVRLARILTTARERP